MCRDFKIKTSRTFNVRSIFGLVLNWNSPKGDELREMVLEYRGDVPVPCDFMIKVQVKGKRAKPWTILIQGPRA